MRGLALKGTIAGKPMLRAGDTGDWIGTFEGHKGAVWGVDINKDASKAATGAADFSAKVWDALSGEEELTLQHKHIVKSVNFSNDSAALATGSNDKVLRIFDLEQPSEPIIKLEGHTGGIKQVMYSPDNKQLLSCSDDKTVRVWDTGEQFPLCDSQFYPEYPQLMVPRSKASPHQNPSAGWSLARRATSSHSLLDTRSSSLMPTGEWWLWL